MIRRFLLLIFLLLLIKHAQSQVIISLLLGDRLNSGKVEFGLDGGLNLSSQSGVDQGKMRSDFNLGFYFDIKLKKDPWMIHTGVIVRSTMGAGDIPVYYLEQADLDTSFKGGSIERKLSYFNVPVLMKYKFSNQFYAEAGPQLGLLYKAYDEFNNTIEDNELTYKKDIFNQFYRLDAGIMAGLGYRLMKGNGINIGVRYYYGLLDAVIDDSGSSVMNRSLYFTAGIPIGVGKAKEKELKKEGK